MKHLIYILTVLSTNLAFGQIREFGDYLMTIHQLKAENKLIKVSYPNMSSCGGAVDGYYLDKNLVQISAQYNAELGFTKQEVFFNNDTILRIDYKQNIAEWGKYDQNYPADKYDWDPDKMTYTDTSYIIMFSDPIIFIKWGREQKIVKREVEQKIVNQLRSCAQEMKQELQIVVLQVDSLRFIKEMPYISENGLSGDKLYWEVVVLRDNGIELLIDKLDDTTLTSAPILYFGGNYTVADIAFTALSEIIHKIPTFELLGVPFDEEGCGYCSYWQHLNENLERRQKFKIAVREWYHKNKRNLMWVESNDFYTCDCKGKHPNQGHYELKQ